ncbi:MAG TPA: acyltransferase, partial [Gemmataceae bacterium]|nr:acyltransferase [Gemmataceae bacterium]
MLSPSAVNNGNGSALRSTRYRLLDAWRGVACLMIVIGHASGTLVDDDWSTTNLPGLLVTAIHGIHKLLFTGVAFFFVISGYCIAASADSARRHNHGAALFFWRRFRRIYPPYWIFLLLLVALFYVSTLFGFDSLVTQGECRIPDPGVLTLPQWLGNLTLTETWRPYVIGSWSPKKFLFGPAWTLCFEEQFYALCGLLLLLAPRHLFRGAIVITVFTLAMLPFTFLSAEPRFSGFFFDGHWLNFAAGIWVFYFVTQTQKPWVWRQCLIPLGGLAGAIVLRYGMLPAVSGVEQKTVAFELIFGACMALVLALLHRWDARLAAVRLIQPLALCGQLCYSLYLLHWPVTILVSHSFYEWGIRGLVPTLLVTVPVATGLSIGAAWVFHVLVERR